MRKLVVEYTKDEGVHGVRPDEEKDERECKEEGKPRYYKWAELMRRTFDIDVMSCPKCGGPPSRLALWRDYRINISKFKITPKPKTRRSFSEGGWRRRTDRAPDNRPRPRIAATRRNRFLSGRIVPTNPFSNKTVTSAGVV